MTRDQMPTEIQQLIAQCEANVVSFTNDQMSCALSYAEGLQSQLSSLESTLTAVRGELEDYRRRYKSICTILCWMNEPPLQTIERDLCNRRDMLEELQEEAATLRTVAERLWQPIETAPKDSRVLLFIPGESGCCGVAIGQWKEDRYAKKPRPYWTADTEWLWGKACIRQHQPTHWMPFPDAPAALSTTPSERNHDGE